MGKFTNCLLSLHFAPLLATSEMTESVEAVVVGAGVVGLAVARSLALSGREVIILEKEMLIGSETSSRNSEVIHAGIYYPATSLMARYCVEGRKRLYNYCQERGIPHKRVGKLITACDAVEAEKLPEIIARAQANGVDDLTLLSRIEAERIEPALRTFGALLSPSTGIVDSHAYMLSLHGDLEAAGAVISFGSPVLNAKIADWGFSLEVGGRDRTCLRSKILINAAGLYAPGLAASMNLAAAFVPTPYYARGSYFSLTTKSPFSHLVYPFPVSGALGIHLTLDLAGRARFGPDIEWIETIDYAIASERSSVFYEAIRRYWPELPDDSLAPAFSGIRPKIVPPCVASQDFRIDDVKAHGIPGLINLFGIESPGLTSSLALADAVNALLVESGV